MDNITRYDLIDYAKKRWGLNKLDSSLMFDVAVKDLSELANIQVDPDNLTPFTADYCLTKIKAGWF